MIDVDEAFAPLARTETAFPSKVSAGASWTPLVPVPGDAPKLTMALINVCAPPGYAYAKGWRYLDADTRLLGCIVRYDRSDAGAGKRKKEFRPFTFCRDSKGRREWRCQAWPEPRPLYGLDKLAARPDAPVLVVEGEKTADAAAQRFPDHAAVTSPGGAEAPHAADWSPLAGRVVVIWPDADKAGAGYAGTVAAILSRLKASSVRVVKVTAAFNDGWDLADPLPTGVDEAEIARLLAAADEAIRERPLPLFPELPTAEPYPIEALGAVLAPAAAAIAGKIQVPIVIAAQSVLAVASLAAQAHADVMLPYGQTRPLSLFLVTVAGSGDRKSSADNEALRPVRLREQQLKSDYERELHAWLVEQAVWNAERKKIEADRKSDSEARTASLLALGPEPASPLLPLLTAPEPTVEGLAKAWVSAPAALGIFTAEGGQFIGGHGMSLDNKLKTAAACSSLWDGQAIKRVRVGDGVTILDGRRLAMHLMVQPDVAALFLADTVLRDQGLLSRFLVAAPESIAGTRLYRDTARRTRPASGPTPHACCQSWKPHGLWPRGRETNCDPEC